MSGKHGSHWLEREDKGSVTVVRLKLPKTLDDGTARLIFDPIQSLATEAGRKQIVLNLSAVERVESLFLGKLVMLNRKVQASEGRLVLCQVTQALQHALESTHLTDLLTVCPTEEEAVQSLT
jgi:anti-sigma B factor antagonist